MANENSKTPTQAQPQMIPLSKIHDLPNVFNPKPQDKTLGSMVLSIESSGVKEAVILRQRSDGEYELLSGYRRRRASELAKKQDIPAHVYEMTMQEAIAYRKAVKNNPNAPIPGKLVVPNADKDMQYRIDTDSQLAMLGDALQGQIDLLVDYRKELYEARREGRDVEAELETVNGKLRSTRRELTICRKITEDIPKIRDREQLTRQQEQRGHEAVRDRTDEQVRKEKKGKWM
mgnify:CR=1 FL=1|jgi:ParB-like chromosome segregation protein Spo0J